MTEMTEERQAELRWRRDLLRQIEYREGNRALGTHGNDLADAVDEIDRLRAELAAVTEERDYAREVAGVWRNRSEFHWEPFRWEPATPAALNSQPQP